MENILIVEDEKNQSDVLKKTISSKYPDWDIHIATDYNIAVSLINQSLNQASHRKYTLFLLDVQLSSDESDRGGFDIACELRKHNEYYKTPILFLTAISNEGVFALSNFHCYNYITKPYTEQQILIQLEQMLLTGYLSNTITINDINRVSFKISVDDILYIEAKGHIIILHLIEGHIFTREYNLMQLNKLFGDDFIQCHKKYLINKKHVENFDSVNLLVKIKNASVPVSKFFKNNVKNLFQ